MIKFIGKEGISVKVISDSIANKTRITTLELEYPRFIHAEFMTHRMISKNCASSRAIPVEAMHKHILENTAMPVFWGRNQAGMQAVEELTPDEIVKAKASWRNGMSMAIQTARILLDKGLHKQISNRVTEAFQMMKTVATATEWANLLHLRDHPDAQPEFRELANLIKWALQVSIPNKLFPGEWHLPYVTEAMPVNDALMISASCCAQVSYRKSDDSLEKAKAIYDRLVKTDGPMHASPLEHQAKAMKLVLLNGTPDDYEYSPEDGTTHMRVDSSIWSANFKGWIQHRQLIEGNTKW